MKPIKYYLLHGLWIVLALAMLSVPAYAKEDLPNVLWVQTSEGEMFPPEDGDPAGGTVVNDMLAANKDIPAFTSSDRLVDMLIGYEGFCAEPYWDYSQYTIGYGSSLESAVAMYPEIAKSRKITQDQARELLRSELGRFEGAVNSFTAASGIVLNQNQFDALVDFTYNVGVGWMTYKNSDGSWCLLKQMLLDPPEKWTAQRTQESFGTWVHAGGQVLAGLVRRRAEEAALFLEEYQGAAGASPQQDAPPEEPEPAAAPEPQETVSQEAASQEAFSDVAQSAWYYDCVQRAYSLNLMSGHGGGIFAPEDYLSRAQTAQALANFARADLSGYGSGDFADVPGDSWFAPAVGWAFAQEIVNGTGDGTFNPNANISRQHLCSMLARFLRSQGVEARGAIRLFSDDRSISPSSRDDVYFCARLGLVDGVGNGRFDPDGLATRAQMAKLLTGMYDLLAD